ncbi:MAG TPA: hypothetical protein VHP35_16045 [Terriglobia bacterium]|jgi:hypothetical protein|nr:hypothetical protein [Terriglobia bacterium]
MFDLPLDYLVINGYFKFVGFYFTAESGQSLVAHGHAEMLRAPRDEKAL